MTETIIMEELSKSYLETIANRSGYFNCTSRDYGTDLTIRKANLCPTRRRYLTSGKAIDFQVKAVSDKYVIGIDDDARVAIKYNLEVKNYNDLIDRTKENGRLIPLILIVFILPHDRAEWIAHTPEGLVLKRCAYWFEIPQGLSYTNNRTKTMIEIPKQNIISLSFFDEQFAKLDS